MSYSVHGYGQMIVDARSALYAAALQRTVRRGSIVVDIGAGPGIWTLMACEYGASRVYAIEESDSIQLARDLVVANNCADRVEFFQALSTGVALDQRADVIISDLRGVLPLFQHNLPSVADARDRFLVAGGKLIPQEDRLWASLVEAPDLYHQVVGAWGGDRFGVDLRPILQVATNSWRKARVKPEQLLLEPQCWATLNYHTLTHPNVDGKLQWTVSHASTAHGLGVWFDSTLVDGITLTNHPRGPEMIYGMGFFPLSAPVSLESGDHVNVRLRATLIDSDYIWLWETTVSRGGEAKTAFKQSTYFGNILSQESLRKQAGQYRPCRSVSGEVDRFILESMDGKSSLLEIADRLVKTFPTEFKRSNEAVVRVAEISKKYSLHA